MRQLSYSDHTYQTPADSASFFGKHFPSSSFYLSFLTNIYVASRKAKRGNYKDADWCKSSYEVLRALERAGVTVSVSGIEHLQGLDSPCVIIGNHVSMMETTVLPVIISPIRRVTFVIKESLLAYPVFKHVMRSRNPVAVSRNNPRQDLKTVLEQGTERLKQGISIVVFPQTTRGTNFEPEQFSTIGIKLASKAAVPVLPLALKTDAWTNGKWIKDLGRILPERRAYFAFDAPFMVQGKGREEQQRVIDFISGKLIEWNEKNSV